MRRKLRTAARKALCLYDLNLKGLRFINYSRNAIFHVAAEEGEFALRIIPNPGSSNQLKTEIAWLKAIKSEIRVPTPVAGRDGSLVYDLDSERYNIQARAIMFTWLIGEPMGCCPSPDRMQEVGRTIAKLHRNSEGFKPTESPAITNWADEEFGFWIDQAVETPLEITPDEHNKIVQAAVWAKAEYTAVSPKLGIGMIHNDLGTMNIILDGKQVGIIDLEICRIGPFMQDVTLPLAYYTGRDDHSDLKDSLLAGYQEIRPLNATELNTLPLFYIIAALRDLQHILTWPRLSHRPWGPDVLRSSMEQLRRFEDYFAK
jgi:Ser/Thr protein kinase RdoA (MazF antagonist)